MNYIKHIRTSCGKVRDAFYGPHSPHCGFSTIDIWHYGDEGRLDSQPTALLFS